ncbi:MAG: isochorismatase family protein [Acidimicrobiia bacterium]|nr:isochorismatase family protein [Acidimicrobiia bacterium]
MHTFESTTALIVVDMQNDFADPDGSLFVSGGEEIVSAINHEIIRAAAAGAYVVYTQDWHPASTPHFQKDGGIWPVHCVGESWGAELHPRLIVAGPTVRKGANGEDGYSGFTMRDPETGTETPTELTGLLHQNDIVSAVVVGLALDYCVGATALDATAAGFRTRVPLGYTAAVELTSGDGERMVAALHGAGVEVG